ncbi:MAG: NAD(P) transhydrogenase subunit alpha part 2 [Myxococcaceae bacterium]
MQATSLVELYVFVLAGFVGFQIITRVPSLLHTPLMSATNAISGISLVGSLVAAGSDQNRTATWLGFVAVTAATINVVGGFLITDRMLKMFRPAEKVKPRELLPPELMAPKLEPPKEQSKEKKP